MTTINEEVFQQRYNNLNEQQKQAVDTIYGPVMVIAGPGTGKTEVLSMRIANLLRSEAQVQPSEILCLTYTDEATNAMRKRLVQVIGTAAHKVNIATFHAFCNTVIQSNSDYFSLRSLQPITDLERTELLYELLEQLPQGHVLRKLSGNIYFDANRLNRLFDLMKREHITPAAISTAVSSYLDSLPEREEYIYKRAGKGYSKGDLKQALLDEEKRRMEITDAAATLFDTYTKKMKEAGRYDFNDMILWVLDAFNNNPALLQSYQERYQFILVDEFQDTNGSQNELLTQLTEFWEDPNIFVVGDDDQSIYEFQGARIRNIIDFYQRYNSSVNVIVLSQNYRSSQPILDKATATIQNNVQRLINQINDLQLDKNIVAAAQRFADPNGIVHPVIKTYSNILHEEADIILQIEALANNNVSLNDVAILYAQHKQADNLIALMERKGIPYNVKRQVNVLELPLVQNIVKVLKYLDEERKQAFSAEALLFEILHAPYYDVNPTDIALLSIYIQTNRTKDKRQTAWRFLLTNNLLLESLAINSVAALSNLGNRLDEWIGQQMELPLPLLLEKIIYESGMVAYIAQTKEHIWNLQVLHTFFEFVREVYSRSPRTKVSDLLRMLAQMNDENIAVPAQKIIQNDAGVKLYTAHGAKGNEFEYVFLIGCTKNYWEAKKGAGNEYKLPDTITRTNDDADKTYKTEVARRLFYVALTRAKKHLQVSYAVADNQGKPLEHSLFIDEISTAEERHAQNVSTADVLSHIDWAMQPVPEVQVALANQIWIERLLQSFTMSYTSLSKFLRCPLAFYYESLLRVPFLKNDALAFGSAVHYALERMFKEMQLRQGVLPEVDEVIGYFKSSLYSEHESFTPVQYERRQEQGVTLLTEYYEANKNSFWKDIEVEFKVSRYLLDGVPVTGKIDKIELNGDQCNVVDFKTGDPDKSSGTYTAQPNDKEPLGGDYWRQMVFYKILIENYEEKNWKFNMGRFEYLEKSKKSNEYKTVHIPVFPQDEEIVRSQLKQAYVSIMNYEFDRGCGKDDCYWCNFARKYNLIRPSAAETIEIDDI